MAEVKKKTCADCREDLPEASYSAGQWKLGSGRCRSCIKLRNQKNYAANRDAYRATMKAYQHANREQLVADQRRRYRENREQIIAKRREQDALWREEHGNQTRTRNSQIAWVRRLRLLGITPEDYDRILDRQRGVCALCGTPDPGPAGTSKVKTFVVDHCHETGAVRGLLCHLCNRGLGLFKDSPEALARAASYVKQCCPTDAAEA